MKKLNKIKLNQFSSAELDQRKLNDLKGGCSYCYASCGGCSCYVSIMNGVWVSSKSGSDGGLDNAPYQY